MAQSISCWVAIVMLVMVFLSSTCASRHILQSEKETPLDISKEEGSSEEEMVRFTTTGEESEREVPTGPDPIHHHAIPKTRSAYIPKKIGPTYSTKENPATQFP